MKKITGLVIMLFVLALTFGSAFAATYPHKEGKVEITIPDSWKVTAEGDGMRAEVKGDTDADNLTIDFELVKADDLEKSLVEAEKWITKELGVIKSEKTAEIELNGMKTYVEDFTAQEGKMAVSIALILTPANKFLCLYYFATPEAEKKHEKVITGIIQSIKPLAEAEVEKK